MCGEVLVVVYKQCCAPTRVLHLERSIGIALYAALAVAVQVQVYPVGLKHLRLAVFDVYLSGHGFVALFHAGYALAHLYGLHPWTRHIAKAEGCCHCAEIGDVLREHLHVGSAQSQQLNLLGTG